MSAVLSLPVLQTKSNSELSTWLACQMRHFYSYGMRRKPARTAEALDFGTLWHLGMAAWWKPNQTPEERFAAAVEAMATDNAMTLATLTELMRGYTARWSDARYTAVAIEREFSMPLVNPDTGDVHPTVGLMGILDKVVREPGSIDHVLEHKTTASDIESGSSYWDRVRTLDSQVSGYMDGARALGFDVVDCIYDVVRKPTIKPYKATPEESRKYKKDGTLYANQRETDETPEEYAVRLAADIAENPGKYYARGTIVRLEADELRHRRDTWSIVAQMSTGLRPVHNRFACGDFGGCDFKAVCEGRADINDPTLFVTKESRAAVIARGKGG